VAWDGCDDLGAPLPDGTYLVTANAAGLSGVAREGRASVVLDTAVPTLTVQPVAPAVVNPSGGVVGTKANTSYAITEPCAVKAVVRDQAGVAVHAIQGWTSRGAGEYTLTWDGRAATDGQRRAVADGTYTVEVTARDGAGNRVAQAVPLTIDRSLRLDAASQQYLSPNGDGRADSAVLTFTTVRAAKVQMAVGRVGREVLTTPLGKLASGEHQAAWDGRDALGAIVPDGKYLMLLSLANGAGGSRAGAYAVVDTKQPRIRVGKPSKVRLGRTAVTTCLATDAGSRFVDVKVVVRNAKGKVVRRAQMKAVTTGKPWRFRFLPPRRGRYTATFTLVDLAGNRQLKPAIWKVQVR
jgi:flagellar hook assembly protein FlgD